jgi:hypothetical protein
LQTKTADIGKIQHRGQQIAFAQSSISAEFRIARKNRSASGTAIGDYHFHEHRFANRKRIRNRFHDAQNRHDAARKTRARRIS